MRYKKTNEIVQKKMKVAAEMAAAMRTPKEIASGVDYL